MYNVLCYTLPYVVEIKVSGYLSLDRKGSEVPDNYRRGIITGV